MFLLFSLLRYTCPYFDKIYCGLYLPHPDCTYTVFAISVAELIVVIWATNTFTKWTSKKMKKEITTTEKNSLSDSEQEK